MKTNAFTRCLTLLLAALMLSGMLALAGTAEPADAAGSATTYDVIYSSANPIPEIAARVRPAIC